MVRTRRSTNETAGKRVALGVSVLSLRLRRKISSVILLLSLICAPVRGIAQSNEQEKRGIGIPPATQTSTPATPAAPGDKPELILQTGHTRSAIAVAFSPDNRWLASGGKDNVVKIWDLATGNVLRTLYGHTKNVNALAVSPDGKLLASGSGDINDKRDLGAFTPYEKGMYILTAAQSYQAAQEASQLGHGLLTYALVEEGLKQAAADSDPKDGEVWVREWL